MEKSDTVKETAQRHPLDPLSAEEVSAAVRALRTHGPAKRPLALRFGQPARTSQSRSRKVSEPATSRTGAPSLSCWI